MSQANADTTGKLRVDFLAVHWYGWNAGSCEANASTLESYLKQIEAIPGNRPIWITEWGCMNLSNPDMATVQAFFSGALAMFARHPRIERYAWAGLTPILLGRDGVQLVLLSRHRRQEAKPAARTVSQLRRPGRSRAPKVGPVRVGRVPNVQRPA